MEEEKIIVPMSEVELTTNATLYKQETAISETVDEISVEAVQEMTIDVSEATGVVTGTHVVSAHTHEIDDITNLLNKLKQLGSAEGTVYSSNGGYAEFRTWKPLAQNAEVGRFVGLVYQDKADPITGGNTFIEVCDGNTDVYGVTVGKSAFCGYQDPAYCLLEPTDNDALNCAKVCLLGVVSVRQGADYDGAKVGDYVVSDKYGCAIRSENGVGFRVVGVGQLTGSDSYWNYKYVDIALVPQNDNVARVMAELEGTKQNLGSLSIQIGKLEDDINNSIISIIPDMEEALEDVNGAISDTQDKLDSAQDALDKAQQISSDAQAAIEIANKEYKEAISNAQQAVTNANNSLSGLNQIKSDLEVLDIYSDKNTSGIAGFVAKVEKDSQALATLNTRYDEMGNHITLINQKIDENGAAIEHLVAHADKYSVGDYSLTHNLTCEEARGLLGDGEYIYIPTLNPEHIEMSPLYIVGNLTQELYAETEYYLNVNSVMYSFIPQENLGMNFVLEFNTKTKELRINNKYIGILSSPKEIDEGILQIEMMPEAIQVFTVGTVYVWHEDPDTKLCWWKISDLVVSFSANEPTENLTDGYLWYTHDGWRENNVWVYEPRTLYRYSEAKKIWVAVARANDGNARTMSFINQTAKEISSTVTNLGGDVSTVKQEVGSIISTVSEIDGDLTRINQTAEAITLGAHSPNKGMSSLEILLNGMRGVSNYSEHVLVGEFSGEPSSSITKYRTAPTWTSNGFSFEGAIEAGDLTIPTYYFDYVVDEDGKLIPKTTYYCEQIDKDIYRIYTIGNQAMANISTRVDENESAIEGLARFDTEVGTRLVSVEGISNENSAQISSIAAMQNVVCVEINSELTEEETNIFESATKYSNPPIWNANDAEFKFSGKSSENGAYCITNNTKEYYKIINTANGLGYERYELSSVKLATIKQEVDKNGASISMVVGDDGIKGGIIASAINGQSEVLLEANKIGIDGTTVFKDNLNDGTTTISGDYIRTGILKSNNYNSPIVYKKNGVLIDSWVENGKWQYMFYYGIDDDDIIYYSLISKGVTYILTSDITSQSYYLASSIKDKTFLTRFEATTSFTATDTCYIVSDQKFFLSINENYIDGICLNLDMGTIHSKNFVLDQVGNVSITGKITATSGYIGDSTNGFLIKKNGSYYSLSNSQNSLDGGNTGKVGVYISPNGIGCGNGLFLVNRNGNVRFKNVYVSTNTWWEYDTDDIQKKTSLEGLAFSLYSGANFIGWSGTSAFSDIDEMKLYYHKGVSTLDFVGSDTNTNDELLRAEGVYCNADFYMEGSGRFYGNSDYRLKTNIENININAIELLKQIELKSFDWIETKRHENIGIIAQQLETIIPELVIKNGKNNMRSINFMGLIPYLVKAVQELSEAINPSMKLFNVGWTDDMTEDEKQYYVKSNKFFTKNSHIDKE